MSSTIALPRGMETVNNSPEISRYYGVDNLPYVDTLQVLTEVVIEKRYVGQTFNVAEEEWWFENGVANSDLVLKFSVPTITQRIFTVMLSEIGATDFNDDIPAKIKTYAIANGIQKLPNETHDWEVIEDFNFYLRISGTDMYDVWGIEDESTFVSFLDGQGATNIVVTDFYLSTDTLRCNLSFDGITTINLGYFGITKIVNLDSLVNLNVLYLGSNQLTIIENLDALVNLNTLVLNDNQLIKIENLDALVNLTTLVLSSNQLTKIENLDALVNLTYLDLSYNQLTTIEFNKLNSWAILAPSNGQIFASNNTDNFNLSTTYTTLLAKGWTIDT